MALWVTTFSCLLHVAKDADRLERGMEMPFLRAYRKGSDVFAHMLPGYPSHAIKQHSSETWLFSLLVNATVVPPTLQLDFPTCDTNDRRQCS